MNTFKNREIDITALNKKTKGQLIQEIERITNEYNNLGWKEDDAQIVNNKLREENEGLELLNKAVGARLDYWIADFSEQKQAYINLCVSSDLDLIN